MLKYWKKKAVRYLTVWLVKNLLRAVHEDELLAQNPASGNWYLGKRRLGPEEVSQLAAEAREFKNSFLWHAMTRDIRYMAYHRATLKAQTPDDLIYSSAMYYNLGLLEGFMDKLIKKVKR